MHYKNRRLILFLVLCCFSLLTVYSVFSSGNRFPDQETDLAMRREQFKVFALKITESADQFRLRAAITPNLAFDRFATKDCLRHWYKDIKPLFGSREMELCDFFGNAVILLGCLDGEKAVAGFYNPWMDGIIISEWFDSHEGIKLDRFLFMSGESFRQDAVDRVKPELPPWQRSERTIARALAYPYLNTTDRFEQMYPLTGNFNFFPEHLKIIAGDENQKREVLIFQKRLRLRMQMFQEFIEADKLSGLHILKQKAIAVKTLIQQGARTELEAMITGPQSRMMLDALFNEAAALKADLGYNCVLLKQNRGAVTLVNPRAPQWFIVIYIDIDDDNQRASLRNLELYKFEMLRFLEEPAARSGD